MTNDPLGPIHVLGGGNSNIFSDPPRILGEDEPILTCA